MLAALLWSRLRLPPVLTEYAVIRETEVARSVREIRAISQLA